MTSAAEVTPPERTRGRLPRWCKATIAASFVLVLAGGGWLVVGAIELNGARAAVARSKHALGASHASADRAASRLSGIRSDAGALSSDAHQVLDLAQQQLDILVRQSSLARQAIDAFQSDSDGRYNALRDRENQLVGQFNATVDEVNRLIAQHIGGAL